MKKIIEIYVTGKRQKLVKTIFYYFNCMYMYFSNPKWNHIPVIVITDAINRVLLSFFFHTKLICTEQFPAKDAFPNGICFSLDYNTISKLLNRKQTIGVLHHWTGFKV